MSSNGHHVFVGTARGSSKYQFVCSCGARGWQSNSYTSAQQMGKEHIRKRQAK
ncbi:hypothetical protein SAMN05216489_03799 [Streptomyces sp. 3213]|uniref:hypothetical protein n=1 Tax=Streptomyces sp. 3213.3 TaxID=1855348 RepID=UPI00089AF771|nr:hypothetical protein [Streptomyces sp. 3213.3]SED56777.1 hypothetical protein SAMN05216489_03799 [Streptomyces sp. 3213] [Streptomyces sp. 3213.3]